MLWPSLLYYIASIEAIAASHPKTMRGTMMLAVLVRALVPKEVTADVTMTDTMTVTSCTPKGRPSVVCAHIADG